MVLPCHSQCSNPVPGLCSLSVGGGRLVHSCCSAVYKKIAPLKKTHCYFIQTLSCFGNPIPPASSSIPFPHSFLLSSHPSFTLSLLFFFLTLLSSFSLSRNHFLLLLFSLLFSLNLIPRHQTKKSASIETDKQENVEQSHRQRPHGPAARGRACHVLPAPP